MNRSFLRYSLALCATVAIMSGCRSSAAKAPTPAGAGTAARVVPAAVTPSNIALGDSIFNNGRAWVQLKTGSFEEIVGIINSGVPADKIKDPKRTRAMGARGGRMALTDPQIQAVAAYVYTLTHK